MNDTEQNAAYELRCGFDSLALSFAQKAMAEFGQKRDQVQRLAAVQILFTDAMVAALAQPSTAEAVAAERVPDGLKLVPVEPTPEQVTAAESALRTLIESVPVCERETRWGKPHQGRGYLVPNKEKHRARYQAMLAAAPAPPQQGEQG